LIPTGKQSGLQMRIAATESVALRVEVKNQRLSSNLKRRFARDSSSTLVPLITGSPSPVQRLSPFAWRFSLTTVWSRVHAPEAHWRAHLLVTEHLVTRW